MNSQPKHIVHSYDEELAEVRRQVGKMGELVATQLEKLMDAVVREDSAVAFGITKREAWVNQLEVEADTQIFVLLAKRCPVAGDLRLVMAASKIVTHLERVGDEVAKAANVLLEQFQCESGSIPADSRDAILETGRRTLGVLREAIGAFTATDFALARRLIASRGISHSELEGSMRRIMETVATGPKPLSDAVNLILIVKVLDRLNDLAVEIAKDVIFLDEDPTAGLG